MALKKLPVGVESFLDFAGDDYCYIDKTLFIAELIENKGIEGLNYEEAKETMKFLIGETAESFYFLLDSDELTNNQKMSYRALIEKNVDGSYGMSDVSLKNSIRTLSHLLQLYYKQKTIILIDEYDVPLDKAFEHGYYEEMILLIRKILSEALKGNPSLEFAVLTGCLRISKESIFTGLNNLKIHGITDSRYDEYFGFTQTEVEELLEYYGLSQYIDTIKEWYNGYQFGDVSVYCPWDVVNYCDALRENKEAT